MTKHRIREIAQTRGVDAAMQVAWACKDPALIEFASTLQRQARHRFPLLVATAAMQVEWGRRRRAGNPASSLYLGSKRRIAVQTAAQCSISALSGKAIQGLRMMQTAMKAVGTLTELEVAARRAALAAARVA